MKLKGSVKLNTTLFLNNVIGNIFGCTSVDSLPSTYYIGLSTTTPNIDGTGISEPPTSAGYSRMALGSVTSPVNGVVTNGSSIAWSNSTDSWGTITHFVIFDSETDGSPLVFGELSSPRVIEESTSIVIKSGALSLSLSNPS